MPGRPSIPMETKLRLMFLKARTGLGHSRLCAAVADSLSWRRFCRPGLECSVPDESDMPEITCRCGAPLIEDLNAEPLGKADAAGLVDLGPMRADTTVVEAAERSDPIRRDREWGAVGFEDLGFASGPGDDDAPLLGVDEGVVPSAQQGPVVLAGRAAVVPIPAVVHVAP